MLTAKRANPSSKREVTFRLFSIMFLVFNCASFFFFSSFFWGGGGGADEGLGGWGEGRGLDVILERFFAIVLLTVFSLVLVACFCLSAVVFLCLFAFFLAYEPAAS